MKISCILGVFVILFQFIEARKRVSPILIIPGIGGSRLQVRDTKRGDCYTKKYELISPYKYAFSHFLDLHCLNDHLKLSYNSQYKCFENRTNDINIRPYKFGSTKTVEYLIGGPLNDRGYPYLHDMVKYFVKKGYKRDKNIRAAGYDWRLAGDELQRTGYYEQLRNLIEKMYTKNSDTKVTLIAHSMGGIVTLDFLNSKFADSNWKSKHIHGFISLGAPWAGSTASLESVLSFYHKLPSSPLKILLKSSKISELYMPIVRSLESLYWLLPDGNLGFGGDVILRTPKKSYTANDYREIFDKVDKSVNTHGFVERVQKINSDFAFPNVPTYCYYGKIAHNTPKTYTFGTELNKNMEGDKSKIDYGSGDNTVNLVSLETCLRWQGEEDFHSKIYKGVSHQGIVTNKKTFDDIWKIVGVKQYKFWEKFVRIFGRKFKFG